jgi:hypothetical protein
MRRIACALVALAVATAASAQAPTVVARPADHGRALINPGMGLTLHFYSNVPGNYGSRLEPSDALAWFPGCSVVYLRIPWAYLEPEEGVYNWAAFDTPSQRWLARGCRVAFRVTCSESWLRFAPPEWVKRAEVDAGARPGTTTAEAQRIKALERENRELRRANEILRTASAFFAQAELDRKLKP